METKMILNLINEWCTKKTPLDKTLWEATCTSKLASTNDESGRAEAASHAASAQNMSE